MHKTTTANEPCSIHPDPRVRALEDRITELAAHIDAATFQWLELIREFDERGGWAGDGISSCAHWLGWKCGMNLHSAREKLRVANALKDLPRISEAFREGRISYSKARAITRGATPGNEAFLLGIALNGTAWHVERAVQLYRRAKRIEALERDRERHDLRELTWFYDEDGCLVMKARFAPEQGAVVRKALQAVMEQISAERKDVPAETAEFEEPSPLKPAPAPVATRRADALVRMAEQWLAGSGSACSSGDRFVVNVHTDLETLKADGTGAEAELEDAGTVSAETSRRLACDAAVVHWLEDHDGAPLSVGRKTRTVPSALRRALQRRDRGCRFPGCTCSIRFVDAHHIHHWADGGATNLENLVTLCRHHHGLVHEGGFGLERTIDGVLRFTDPDGKHIPEVPAARPSGDAFELMARNEENGIRITPRTPVPGWLGEKMDEDLVIFHLKRLE
jgi:hypothetical protein